MEAKRPSISIVTVVYNSVTTIADCLDSVLAQGIQVEHIVIDGGSTDGTLEVLERYRPWLARIVSEPDRGIYDAMNKGIALATGEVVGILNADDFYASHDVLQRVAEMFCEAGTDSCYGDLLYVDANDTSRVVRSWRSGSYHERAFYWGWMPPHPTFFVRRQVYERCGLFKLSLGSAADYGLMLSLLVKEKISTAYIPDFLVKMRAGGVSNASLANRLRANRMDRRAWDLNGLRPYPWTTYVKPLRKIGQFLVK